MFKLLLAILNELFASKPPGVAAHSKPLPIVQFMPKLDTMFDAMCNGRVTSKSKSTVHHKYPERYEPPAVSNGGLDWSVP